MPQPYAPDRAALADALDRELAGKTDYSVLWLSDGLDYGEGDALDRRRLPSLPAARPAASPCSGPRQRRCGARARPSRSARTAGSPRGCCAAPRRPALRRGQGGDRPRRAARRSAIHCRRWRAARPPRNSICRSRSATRWRGIEIAGERSAGAVYPARRPLAMASGRHRLGRIARGRAAAAVAALLCAARALALCRRHHAGRGQCRHRGA